jgi:hypothetical protein
MKLSRPLQIFLLYAHRDQRVVQRLYRRLIQDGVAAWMDQKNILPGQDWAHEIHRAIWKSDMVLVCLSRAFIKQGGFRHEELKIALARAARLPEGRVFLIPARLEECELPASLRRWQCVDLFQTGGYRRLMRVFELWTRDSRALEPEQEK